MRNKRTVDDDDPAPAQHARYEVLPTASTEDKVLAHVPRDVAVTVTASPGKGLEATLDLAERLAGHGYVVVPAPRRPDGHAAAPSSRRSRDRLTGKGISRVFVPGGDADPAGDYPDALSPAARTSPRWAGRSPTSGSPATRSRTPRSTTT